MSTALAIASVIFFHRGDFIPAYEFTHFPCKIEPLYITGLDETQAYLHSDGLYIYEDRTLYHISPRVTRFEIRDNENSNIIGNIHIRWKTDCEQNENLINTTLITQPATTTTASKVIIEPTTSSTTTKSVMQTTIIVTTNHQTTPDTSLRPPINQTSKLATTNSNTYQKKSGFITGVVKKVVELHGHYDLLADVYMHDNEGNDVSHKLSHTPFTNTRAGIYIVEIHGTSEYSHIRTLMEVEVIDNDAQHTPNKKHFMASNSATNHCSVNRRRYCYMA